MAGIADKAWIMGKGSAHSTSCDSETGEHLTAESERVPLRLLLIEDSEDDAWLLLRHLKQNGFTLDHERVDNAEALRAALRGPSWDLILCDFNMPLLQPLDALIEVKAAGLDVPFIVVSGTVSEEKLVDLMKAGAHDIVNKNSLTRLVPAIERELADAVERRERRQAEANLRDAIETISEGFALYDADDRLVVCNQKYLDLYDRSADRIVPGAAFEDILRAGAQRGQYPSAEGRIDEWVVERMALRRSCAGAFEQQLADGRWLLINENRTQDGGTVSVRTDITEQKKAEASLRESEERFRTAFETAPHGMALVAPGGRWLKVNRALCDILGYDASDLLQTDYQSVTHPDDLKSGLEQVQRVLDGEMTSYQREKRFVRNDGEIIWALLSVALVRGPDGAPLYFVTQFFDLTERKKTEAQLAQAQKMEAVGQLTGGIAHDFNNLLTVIVCNLELLEDSLAGDEELSAMAKSAQRAAQRGADLTARLPAFSRRQFLQPKTLDLADLISGMEDLLRRSLSESITIERHDDADLWPVEVDVGQMETAILNLAVNARDAMPKGGRLTIETAKLCLLDDQSIGGKPISRGEYVRLSVSDTGTGMADDVLLKVFEPFFTTKEVGKGTGLGLSMVFGFVEQSGGHIRIYSEEGHGTTVNIYLPRADSENGRSELEAPVDDATPSTGAEETVLVVEDDPEVRQTTVSMLTGLRYRVLEAENGAGALSVLSERDDIDLLFTDVVMPGGMTGLDLAREAVRLNPAIKVLFTSGYSKQSREQRADELDDIVWLNKPYQRAQLAEKVRAALT